MSLSKNPETNALLARADDDQATLRLINIPDFPFGQHVQAAIEKCYKALLNDLVGGYPYIHDLDQLRDLLTKAGETVPNINISLSQVSLYASHLRYDDDNAVSALNRQTCSTAVQTIRDYVELRIKQLNQAT